MVFYQWVLILLVSCLNQITDYLMTPLQNFFPMVLPKYRWLKLGSCFVCEFTERQSLPLLIVSFGNWYSPSTQQKSCLVIYHVLIYMQPIYFKYGLLYFLDNFLSCSFCSIQGVAGSISVGCCLSSTGNINVSIWPACQIVLVLIPEVWQWPWDKTPVEQLMTEANNHLLSFWLNSPGVEWWWSQDITQCSVEKIISFTIVMTKLSSQQQQFSLTKS